jgi:hypothetical protein
MVKPLFNVWMTIGETVLRLVTYKTLRKTAACHYWHAFPDESMVRDA